MYGNGYGLMGIGMWLFWIILVVIILLVIKAVTKSTPTSVSREMPIDILKERYAKGEIDDEEFQRRKHELEK